MNLVPHTKKYQKLEEWEETWMLCFITKYAHDSYDSSTGKSPDWKGGTTDAFIVIFMPLLENFSYLEVELISVDS